MQNRRARTVLRNSFLALGHLAAAIATCAFASVQLMADANVVTIGKLYRSSSDGIGEQTVSRRIDEQSSARRWPLLVPSALVVCALSNPRDTLLLITDKKPIALNDPSRRGAAAGMEVEINGNRTPVELPTEQKSWRVTEPDDPSIFVSLIPVIEAATRIGCLRKGESGGIE